MGKEVELEATTTTQDLNPREETLLDLMIRTQAEGQLLLLLREREGLSMTRGDLTIMIEITVLERDLPPEVTCKEDPTQVDISLMAPITQN